MADVFVSYSRRDSDFVRRLVASIEERGKSVWWIPRDRRWGGVPGGLAAGNRGVRCVLVRDHAGVGRVALLRAADRARADVGEADPPGTPHQGADDALHEEVRDRNWIPFEADDGFNGSIGLVRPRSPTTLPGRADGLEGLPQFLSGPSPLIPPADPHRAGRECARPISRDGN